jgi:hypothetical protein
LPDHQLDFTTPGSLPLDANTRKQIRQRPNFLKKALGRPQTGQRLYCRTLNLGSFIAFILSAFFAKPSSLFILTVSKKKSRNHSKEINF